MKLKRLPFFTALLLTLALTAPGFADMQWSVIKTLKIEDQPLDFAYSTSRRQVYVLTDRGDLLIYELDGRLTDTVPVGKEFDRLKHIQGSDVVFLSSRNDKTIKVIELDYVQNIDVSGAPIKGPENAPVVIALFSDFQ